LPVQFAVNSKATLTQQFNKHMEPTVAYNLRQKVFITI